MTCNKSINSEIEYKSLYMLYTPDITTNLYVEARKGGVKTVRKTMTISLQVDLNHQKSSQNQRHSTTFLKLSPKYKPEKKSSLFQRGDNFTQGKQQPKQASLSNTQARHRTQGRLADGLQIQEISGI